jgi:lipoate-protein ligase A
VLPPRQFHAVYAGIAQAAGADAAPVLVWGGATAHLCLGQGQSALRELVPRIDVPVVRRPLGGGAVWVDEGQLVYVMVVPLRHAPRRPAEWSAWALQPASAVFHQFGLEVERRGEDLWLGGRKIAGTGAATIGNCAVFASSFLLCFPRTRFAACMAGSDDYRSWLEQGLAATLTDWSTHAPLPPPADLRAAYCDAVANTLGWRLSPAVPAAAETAAIAEALRDMDDDLEDMGHRRHRDGIKLNAESHLVEREDRSRCIRELVVRGMVMRRAVVAA